MSDDSIFLSADIVIIVFYNLRCRTSKHTGIIIIAVSMQRFYTKCVPHIGIYIIASREQILIIDQYDNRFSGYVPTSYTHFQPLFQCFGFPCFQQRMRFGKIRRRSGFPHIWANKYILILIDLLQRMGLCR